MRAGILLFRYDLRLNGTYNFSRYAKFLNNDSIMRTLGAAQKWTPINLGVRQLVLGIPTEAKVEVEDFLRSSASV